MILLIFSWITSIVVITLSLANAAFISNHFRGKGKEIAIIFTANLSYICLVDSLILALFYGISLSIDVKSYPSTTSKAALSDSNNLGDGNPSIEKESGTPTSISSQTITRTIQAHLRYLGFYDAEVDGIYGPKTYQAIRRLQLENSLEADGQISGELFDRLSLVPITNDRTRAFP